MSVEWIKKVIGHTNIAELLTEEQLVKIAHDVETGYDEDEDSRKEWKERQDGYMKLALQVMEVKNTPWPNAANVKYPLLTTATMQFGARAYPALVTSPSIVKGRVTGYDETGEKAKSADRIGKHMSFQLIEEMDSWEEDMDKLSVSIPILGTMFKKSYFAPSKQTNVSELVYPEKLVVNYWAKSLDSAARVTHLLELSDNDIYERIASGLFLDQEYIKEHVGEKKVSNEVHGLNAPPHGDTTPHKSLEQHCWIDLDNDGYKEPYIVTWVDGKVARIIAGFDQDTVYLAEDRVICIKRVKYFTKYGFIPNPDGSFYDIGFGLLLGPINETINTTINQLLDAGTLSNRQGGFLGRGARLKGGDKSFKPGEWKQINATGDDLRKSIVPMPVRDPSNVLFSLLGSMIEAGKELSNTVPMLMGQNPGQNQTATTSMAVIEQGLKVFSSIFKRMHRSLKQELKLLKRLNRLYLPTEAYFAVLDKQLEGREQIFRQDYSDDVTDVQPYSDPNIVSELQVMIKAQQVSEMMAQGLLPNPQEGAKVVLEAMDLPNIEALMTPPEPQPDPEVEMKKAEFEHKVKIETERLMLDKQRLGLEMDMFETNQEEMKTQAILNLAKAEAADDKNDIEQYKAELKELEIRSKIRSDRDAINRGSVQSVEGKPDN